MDNELDNTNGCEPSLPNTRSSTLTPHDSTSVSPATVIESSQNLSIWTTVDLPGSPLLSRLFKALQIECPTEIPPISIGSPVAECAKTYIADVDVGEISNGKQTDDAMEQGALEANSIPGCSAVVLRKEFPPFSLRKWNLLNESFDEWAFSQWDFSKGQPFNMEISLGPLKPLSPFPILPNTAGHRPPSTSSVLSGRLQALEMEETIYRNRLDRLKRIFNENDPRIILTMSDLAIIYYKQSKHQQRERLLRHIAILTQRTYGFKHRNTLHAYVDVADALNVQGRFRQAAKIHQLVHATMPNLIAPEDELALSSAISRSDTYCGLEQDEEAEKLNRQLLQMRLITLGPKHKKTLRVMERLASSLRYANKLQESEQLLSTVLQLQYEVQDIDEDSIYYNEAKLAELFRCQGRYRESKNLALKAAERSEISLSPEHRETLHCYFQVAVCLGDLGQHAESERLLVRVLEQHVKQLGECYGSAVCAMTYLAYMLEKMGRYQEAVPFREKCFRANVENYGLEHSYSVRNCDRLGRCYETLGRYEDAFSLYQRTVDQLRGTNTDDHPAIVRISCWIAELQDIVAARQEDVCYGQDEMDANQFLSNESDSVKEEEVGGEDNSAKEGSAMNDEDWMKDFVDFRTPKEDPGHPGHPDEQV
jgi:tetratricopeptide (TPR) repeat protein